MTFFPESVARMNVGISKGEIKYLVNQIKWGLGTFIGFNHKELLNGLYKGNILRILWPKSDCNGMKCGLE